MDRQKKARGRQRQQTQCQRMAAECGQGFWVEQRVTESGVDEGPSSQRKAKVGAGSRAGVRPRQQSVDKYFRVSQRVSEFKERTRGRKLKSPD